MTEIEASDIPGVRVIPSNKFLDKRGFFSKIVDRKSLEDQGLHFDFDSVALSSNYLSGTMRGLHFQSHPYAEEKIVACINGSVFDVIVDLRIGSPTFSKWAAVTLSTRDPKVVFLPKGIAHGFQTLEDNSDLIYVLSAPYVESHSKTLSYLDTDLGIKWPLPITNVSEKDSSGLSLKSATSFSSKFTI
jgi:dTDP-4-dehydrorhamnose 3,5-epimerase